MAYMKKFFVAVALLCTSTLGYAPWVFTAAGNAIYLDRDEFEASPAVMSLMRSAQSGDENEVDRLLAQGVDINGADGFGNTALSQAAQAQQLAVVAKLFTKGARPNNFFIEQLFKVIKMSDIDSLRKFLDAGMPLEIRNQDEKTLLIYAIDFHAGDVVIEELCNRGADIDAQDGNGLSRAALIAARRSTAICLRFEKCEK
jgi:ankyrin repeat protein